MPVRFSRSNLVERKCLKGSVSEEILERRCPCYTNTIVVLSVVVVVLIIFLS